MVGNQIIMTAIPVDDLTELIAKAVRVEMSKLYSTTEPEAVKLITEKELCGYLGISLPTAIRYRVKGMIPFIQIGSSIRYDVNAVVKALTVNEKRK